MRFDLQPRLAGPLLTLRPLLPGDLEPLWLVSRDPLVWAQHPDQTRWDRSGFERFFEAAIEARSAFAVVDHATGEVIGSTRYYDWNPAEQEIAIGYTFLARRCWGGPWNREMKALLIDHAFRKAEVI